MLCPQVLSEGADSVYSGQEGKHQYYWGCHCPSLLHCMSFVHCLWCLHLTIYPPSFQSSCSHSPPIASYFPLTLHPSFHYLLSFLSFVHLQSGKLLFHFFDKLFIRRLKRSYCLTSHYLRVTFVSWIYQFGIFIWFILVEREKYILANLAMKFLRICKVSTHLFKVVYTITSKGHCFYLANDEVSVCITSSSINYCSANTHLTISGFSQNRFWCGNVNKTEHQISLPLMAANMAYCRFQTVQALFTIITYPILCTCSWWRRG